ncbi:MAG TPA: VWA domain-containing protein, partial [Vicinamibacterales bacterium]|nr:VWA domain-containing protein [Vicinamibacterales bacterium]
KVITNFYEVEGTKTKGMVAEAPAPAATPAALPAPVRQNEVPENLKRRMIFYIDNLSLAPFNRNRVFADLKEFARTAMRPGDEAMIATYNRSMKVRVPFTRDVNQIISMLDAISRESGLGVANKSEWRSTESRIREAQDYTDAMSVARTYASSVEHDLRQSVASLNALLTTLAGVEGKKILVLTSEGFPMQPGREAFYLLDEVGREKNWGSGSSLLETMSFDGTRHIQSVARTANANGITLYTVHAAGLTGGMEMSAEHSSPVSHTVSYAQSTNTTESMRLMADMTGGLASVQTNNFKDAFAKIERDLESYYSLGYRAGTERVDRQRYLQVKVKNKDYRVRARQTFVEKSVFAEMSDKVVASLLYRVKANDLGVLARTGQPRPTGDGLFVVPIDIQIPMGSLTMLPQGETEYAGGFDVYVVVANKDNDMSDVARKSHQVRVPANEIKNIQGKIYTYTLELLMEPGLNKISIGVVDQISNVSGFTREQIIARDMR